MLAVVAIMFMVMALCIRIMGRLAPSLAAVLSVMVIMFAAITSIVMLPIVRMVSVAPFCGHASGAIVAVAALQSSSRLVGCRVSRNFIRSAKCLLHS